MKTKRSNEIFNVSNGDVYRWRQLWNELAAFYDLPIAEPLAMSTGSEMSEKARLCLHWALDESDEKPFRPADVAEPICVFILDYFAYELRAALAELFKRLVDVVHGEHDAEVNLERSPGRCGDPRRQAAVRKREEPRAVPWPSGVRIMAISTL